MPRSLLHTLSIAQCTCKPDELLVQNMGSKGELVLASALLPLLPVTGCASAASTTEVADNPYDF